MSGRIVAGTGAREIVLSGRSPVEPRLQVSKTPSFVGLGGWYGLCSLSSRLPLLRMKRAESCGRTATVGIGKPGNGPGRIAFIGTDPIPARRSSGIRVQSSNDRNASAIRDTGRAMSLTARGQSVRGGLGLSFFLNKRMTLRP